MNNNNIKHSLLYRMKIKSFLAKPYAAYVKKKIKKDAANAVQDQLAIMRTLINKAAATKFGKAHHFSSIKTYEDFKQHIPIVDYEQFKMFVGKVSRSILLKHRVQRQAQNIFLFQKIPYLIILIRLNLPY